MALTIPTKKITTLKLGLLMINNNYINNNTNTNTNNNTNTYNNKKMK